ncbi:MAG: DUF4386 domain-containing protein [Chloroflexi bacterium]|nr:DUF4386 domain-containing protein [Chloroflexota bacterium]
MKLQTGRISLPHSAEQPQPDLAGLRFKSRMAGAIYLLIIIGGLFAVGFVPAALIVVNDAAATALNIQTQPSLYRMGLAVHLIIALCNIPLAAIFYDLFRLAKPILARMVLFFILVAVAIESVNLLNHFEPLILLQSARYANGIPTEQLYLHAASALELETTGFNLSLAFVGCYCLTAGMLILRSRILPRFVGVLLALGGAAYVINCFISILAPHVAASLFPFIQIPSFLGEASICLWLLIKGVKVDVSQNVG